MNQPYSTSLRCLIGCLDGWSGQLWWGTLVVKRKSLETILFEYENYMTNTFRNIIMLHEAGFSGLVHWDDPERWDGEGEGRPGQDGEHMYNHG